MTYAVRLCTLLSLFFLFSSFTPPAKEWYDAISWESKRVNPYLGRKVKLPERVIIECYPFCHPTDADGRVSSKYGWRKSTSRMHRGIDIALPSGSSIYSVWNGVVRVTGYDSHGFGKYVVVRHHNGLETIYGHLSTIKVKRGENVRAGTVIGLSGNTGRSTGPHLHFEVRFLGGDFNPSLVIDFNQGVLRGREFIWVKSLYPKRRRNLPLKTYRLRETTTLESLCAKKDWDLEEHCLLNGLLPDMPLEKGRIIRIIP